MSKKESKPEDVKPAKAVRYKNQFVWNKDKTGGTVVKEEIK